jgi:SsrA-binding protein
MAKKKGEQDRGIARNRRAYHDYEILEKLEVGISLVGSEVKSLRAGRISLKESFVGFENGQAYLMQAHIPQYPPAGPQNHRTQRKRLLLMKKKQIEAWTRKAFATGYTVIPLSLYFKGSWIKLEIGYGRGRKNYDKRHKLKEDNHKRDLARALRSRD